MKRQFSKDGHVTVATSTAEAVRLSFDGWRENTPTPEPEVAAEPDAPDDQPTPPRKRTSNR